MRLEDVMSQEVWTAAPTDDLERARTEMFTHQIHHLVVVERGKIVGVLSEHDLAARTGLQVSDVMTPDPIVASAHTTVREAANLMRGNHVSCLPVLDDRQRLVGIVTVTDLLELMGRGVTRPIEDHEHWTLRNRGSAREKHRKARMI